MATGDLTTLDNVKAWLAQDGVSVSRQDPLLSRLITVASAVVKQYISKDIVLQTYNHRFNGPGGPVLVLRQQPVVQVLSVAIGGQAVMPGFGTSSGFTYDDIAVYVNGYDFAHGKNNIGVIYKAGYQTLDEVVIVPQADGKINGLADLYDLWCSDLGVKDENGAPMDRIFAGQLLPGQYSVTPTGEYTFAETGMEVRISYGSVPRAIEQVAVELVGERYKARGRIGEDSKVLGGETVSFSTKAINDAARMMLNPYRTMTST